MKNVLIIISFFLFSFFLFAQEPEWLWAERAGSSSYESGYAICSDTEGNLYVTGYFQDTSDFGPYLLTSLGGGDIFVAKMDTNGNWIWVTQAGGTAWGISTKINLDNDGNIYVIGYFGGTINFGSTSLTSSGDNDSFVAKMSYDGNWIWAKKAGGNEHDRGTGICVGADGNIYLTGFFTDIGTFGTFSLISNGCWDIFVAKIDSDGNWLWAERAGGIYNDAGNGINTDTDGNIYVTGFISNLASFGSYNLNSFGGNDIFVTKLNAEGEWLWAVQAGGSDYDYGIDICTDNLGKTFVVGSFSDTASFGNINLSSINNDIFIAKLDMHGNWLYAEQAGGNGGSGKNVVTDIEGNAYMSGSFWGTANFGSYNLTSYGGGDIFVAKMSYDGNWLWASQAGSGHFHNADIGYGISIDADRNVYTTGKFSYTSIFGSLSLTSATAAYHDIFVAKFGNETSISNEMKFVINSLSNYPNPFNPITTIEFSILNDSKVELTIYNIKEQKIKTLVQNEFAKGSHSVIWNGEDESGKPVSSGVYYYKLNVNGKTKAVKKCLLLK